MKFFDEPVIEILKFSIPERITLEDSGGESDTDGGITFPDFGEE